MSEQPDIAQGFDELIARLIAEAERDDPDCPAHVRQPAVLSAALLQTVAAFSRSPAIPPDPASAAIMDALACFAGRILSAGASPASRALALGLLCPRILAHADHFARVAQAQAAAATAPSAPYNVGRA